MDKEWFRYDRCVSMAYKGQHMTYLLEGAEGAHNAREGTIGDMKRLIDSDYNGKLELRAL